jgi:hypothetical protein
MALQEKVTQEDLILLEIIKNPCLAIEFINNFDTRRGDEKFEFASYQKEMMCDFSNYQCYCTARAIGKTTVMTSLIIWALVYKLFPDDFVLFATPSKVHLEPVWLNLIKQFRSNSFLKHFISSNSGINSSDFKITLLNQMSLMCRIAGQTGTGANLIALHTPFILFEESGYFPYNAFQEAQPDLNTFTQGYREIVAGVPTGLRDKNVLFFADQESSIFSKHRIPATKNPRFTNNDYNKAIEQYGGKDNEDFIHYVLGQHGKPVFALFDRGLMEIQNYPVYNLLLNGIVMGNDLNQYIGRISTLPGINSKSSKCIMGIDLGYTEPSAIWILNTDDYGRIKFHGKIRMEKVSYPIQEKIIDLLDSKFEPNIIGIDKGAGGQGISLIQHLTDDKEYIHKNYIKRITPIDFSSNISMGYDSSGEEMKSRTKPFATTVLQDYSNNHKVVFSSTDLEMITELERMTYTKNPSGEIIYRTLTPKGGKKGEDHFTSALLCAILAYYMTNDYFLSRPEKKKLFAPVWIGGD